MDLSIVRVLNESRACGLMNSVKARTSAIAFALSRCPHRGVVKFPDFRASLSSSTVKVGEENQR